jgi:hypothetical protein
MPKNSKTILKQNTLDIKEQSPENQYEEKRSVEFGYLKQEFNAIKKLGQLKKPNSIDFQADEHNGSEMLVDYYKQTQFWKQRARSFATLISQQEPKRMIKVAKFHPDSIEQDDNQCFKSIEDLDQELPMGEKLIQLQQKSSKVCNRAIMVNKEYEQLSMTTKDMLDEVDEATLYFNQEIFTRMKNTANLIK